MESSAFTCSTTDAGGNRNITPWARNAAAAGRLYCGGFRLAMIPMPGRCLWTVPGAAFPVAAGEPSLGRDRSNAMGSDDLAMSRRRTLITIDGEQLQVADLDLFHTRVQRCDTG